MNTWCSRILTCHLILNSNIIRYQHPHIEHLQRLYNLCKLNSRTYLNMNPIFVIFVLVVLGLQDYGINPVSGYDMKTANQIILCANAVYNVCMNSTDENKLSNVTGDIDDGTLNERVRGVLHGVTNGRFQLGNCLKRYNVGVTAKYILGLE